MRRALSVAIAWSICQVSVAADPPPRPVQTPADEMPTMSYPDMARAMSMDDTVAFGKVIVDRAEWVHGDGRDAFAWDAQAWYGGDYDKLWIKTQGEAPQEPGGAQRAELLWDRIFARWWSLQAGIRQDFGGGPARTWLALGVEGLAPQFFEVEATAYVGDAGRSALRLHVQRDLLLTQRLVLRSELEADAYGKSDAARGLGSGLAQLQLGLRLRYEVRREFAPYVGLTWTRRFGATANLARAGGETAAELQAIAGVSFWF